MEAMTENSKASGLRHPPKMFPSSENNNSFIQPPPHLQPREFPSHVDAPDISPMAKILCEILVRAPPGNIEGVLGSTGIPSSPALVEEVLQFSYNYPGSAVKFFRWAGHSHKHSTYSWNLMVDLLGKNQLFEQMWDAIRSMKQEGALSLTTFTSIFGNYCSAGRFNEAIMTFDVMNKYGVEQDVLAVNSLLSAICREDNQTSKALEFYDKIKTKINPDGDTFTLLFEGWEKEGNVTKAKTTFGEMVVHVGWSPLNVSAYDAFLTTLVRGSQAEEAIKFLRVMKRKNCLPEIFLLHWIALLVSPSNIKLSPLLSFVPN
ncbi:hypothetical protein CRG98_003059 [Punica granatum]|uniref:Pentatricopeptide repeat-containing protein n=1 Tax=Punica granatum TaxID=22663 RepID=A0A2I0L725_PUNGR|nr:hypothetical protein CRG98_003059 [Punica granatum]